jgi:hypothetical protein
MSTYIRHLDTHSSFSFPFVALLYGHFIQSSFLQIGSRLPVLTDLFVCFTLGCFGVPAVFPLGYARVL